MPTNVKSSISRRDIQTANIHSKLTLSLGYISHDKWYKSMTAAWNQDLYMSHAVQEKETFEIRVYLPSLAQDCRDKTGVKKSKYWWILPPIHILEDSTYGCSLWSNPNIFQSVSTNKKGSMMAYLWTFNTSYISPVGTNAYSVSENSYRMLMISIMEQPNA